MPFIQIKMALDAHTLPVLCNSDTLEEQFCKYGDQEVQQAQTGP